ncbi:MAG: excinuclease ABC subunit UvrC, partial [Parvularculaceae bacterium]
QSAQDINPGTVTDADVFGIHLQGGQTCVQVFFFRAGQNWGNHAFFPRHDKADALDDILGAFLAQFYDNREPPKLILLSEEVPDTELLSRALSLRGNKKVEIFVPQRGEKVNLVAHAVTNARESLGRRLAETASQKKLMRDLTTTLGLSSPPRRIEVYDNSHISGTNALGGMIVAGEEGFIKNQYRKFNIKFEETNTADDFGMMVEVLTRRFARLIGEETPGAEVWPGLVVIDGGKGHLNAAIASMQEVGIEVGPDIDAGQIMVISISKGRSTNARGEKRVDRTASSQDQLLLPGREPVTLQPRSAVTFYLQNLRDEAHRFAIGSHRARRKKQMTANPLDAIDGVGGKRKKALLHHFGSAKAVARAKREDLASVEGISEALAMRIYDSFHKS